MNATITTRNQEGEKIRRYWEERPPGIRYSDQPRQSKEFFEEVERVRYGSRFHYSWLPEVAEFRDHPGERVLEVGMGLGTDILQFARNGSEVYGVDLTANSVATVRHRFSLYGLEGDFRQADFRELPFEDETFDLVYSFGVLHHSPWMAEGVEEIRRVLKPGGKAIVMLYHKGFKYYVRKLFYRGILQGGFLRYTVQEIIDKNTEEFGDSPCTQVVSRRQARELFRNYGSMETRGFRIDDYFWFRGRQVSPTWMLPKPVARWIEDRFGWNLVIKAVK